MCFVVFHLETREERKEFAMGGKDLYCARCGAANTAGTAACFACGKKLREAGFQRAEDMQQAAEGLLHGRYRLLAAVGEGGFAKVYKAEDVRQGRTVAVKKINLKALNSQERIDATDTY